MKSDFMWAILVHIGNNMWNEEGNTRGREQTPEAIASSQLRFDRTLWQDYVLYLKKLGVNTIIMDVAEAMIYETHPELAVEGSLTKEVMQTPWLPFINNDKCRKALYGAADALGDAIHKYNSGVM